MTKPPTSKQDQLRALRERGAGGIKKATTKKPKKVPKK